VKQGRTKSVFGSEKAYQHIPAMGTGLARNYSGKRSSKKKNGSHLLTNPSGYCHHITDIGLILLIAICLNANPPHKNGCLIRNLKLAALWLLGLLGAVVWRLAKPDACNVL